MISELKTSCERLGHPQQRNQTLSYATRLMSQQYPIFKTASLDRMEFDTRIRFARSMRRDLDAFAAKTTIPLRSYRRISSAKHAGGSQGFELKLLTYGGLKLTIYPAAQKSLSKLKVEMNPAKMLYGHNGRLITYGELLDAFSVYLNHARSLLEDQDDWIDLLPGLRAGGPGRWKLLELPCHCSDPDGVILAAMRDAVHPAIRKIARQWPTSSELGRKRSNMQFCTYQKAIELFTRGKLPAKLLDLYGDILRMEVRLKGKKLIKYLGNEDTIESVDGDARLVRFTPDLIDSARSQAFRELKGVWQADDAPQLSAQLGVLGALIALVAKDPRCKYSFPELVAHVAHYTNTKGSDAIRKICSAGADYLSRCSTMNFDSLLGTDALLSQPSIALSEIECMVKHRCEDIRHPALLESAYLPPGCVLSPSKNYPSYCTTY